MSIFPMLIISIILLFVSLLLYKNNNIKIKKQNKIILLISPLVLMLASLLITKIKIGGTIMSKTYGWPHNFFTYQIKDVVDGVLIDKWVFNTYNIHIYLIADYLFYLSLVFLVVLLYMLMNRKTA